MLFLRVRKCAALAAWVTGLSALAFAEGAAAEPTPGAMGRPALLNDAFNALVEDQGRWAYTETHAGILDGKPRGESSFLIDPSVTYAEQRKPLKIRGKPPTEKQLKEAADREERAAKRRHEQQEKLPEAPATEEKTKAEENPKVRRADEVHLWVSGQLVTPEIDQAKVVKEDETSVTYEVPMHPEGKSDANAILDKFELTARVSKGSHQFERATIRQRAPVRVKLIAKVSDTLLEFEFSTPDARYPSVLTQVTSDSHVTLLFGKDHAMHNEMIRTKLRHVTPYDERFGVKMGPTRTIEF
jgi:hypothetical protein